MSATALQERADMVGYLTLMMDKADAFADCSTASDPASIARVIVATLLIAIDSGSHIGMAEYPLDAERKRG